MKTKILEIGDALRLASVLSNYVDVKEINPETDALDFISNIVDRISPQDYLKCVFLMTEENEETIKKYISIEVLTAFIEGLKSNKVVSLLEFYKSLGF